MYESLYDEDFEIAENKALIAWKIAKNDHNKYYTIYEDKEQAIDFSTLLDIQIKF